MKTKRVYQYSVSVAFDGSNNQISTVGKVEAEYPNGHGNKDLFHFYKTKVLLQLTRSVRYEDGSILTNKDNSINLQILKAVLCYFATADYFPMIKSVEIIRKKEGEDDYQYKETQSINQILNNSIVRKHACNSSIVYDALAENEKGKAIRIALAYWLKGINMSDCFLRFDCFWRSFNRLYGYHGHGQNETDSLRALRSLILANPACFSNSVAAACAFPLDELKSFRWSRMILNDYDTSAKTQALVDFIKRYSDSRIMQILHEKLKCREKFLIALGKKTEVDSHIFANSATVNDIELVSIICIKYAYFVRNKLFHAEMLDGHFKLKDDNFTSEMKRINSVFEVFLLDLITSSDIL